MHRSVFDVLIVAKDLAAEVLAAERPAGMEVIGLCRTLQATRDQVVQRRDCPEDVRGPLMALCSAVLCYGSGLQAAAGAAAAGIELPAGAVTADARANARTLLEELEERLILWHGAAEAPALERAAREEVSS